MYNQSRVVIENITPLINGGELPLKSVVGESVPVTADIIGDGHDIIAASLCFKHEKARKWSEVRMNHIENDSWSASFQVEKQGFYEYKVQGWVDHGLNWKHL